MAKKDKKKKGEENIAVEDLENNTAENQNTDPIADSEAKAKEFEEKYLRLYAEFDNYRRRTAKERLELIGNATEDLMVALLPVIDDFERALKNMEDSDSVKPVKEGVQLIHKKLLRTLGEKGLKSMESPIGKELDTDFHEAITSVPAPDESMKGKIIDEVEKGYMLRERVIRYAKVVVGE